KNWVRSHTEANFCRGSRVGCAITSSQAARLPLQFGFADRPDIPVGSDWKRKWKTSAERISFLAQSSLQSVSPPSSRSEEPRKAARSLPAKLQWAIGKAMRPACDAGSAS